MKKLCIVGAGQRATGSYAVPVSKKYTDIIELAGVYDTNYKRAELMVSMTGLSFPVFSSFDEMLQKAKPDIVLVASVDATHDEYIIKALDFGCDVITEKPMTTDEHKCNAIFEAEKRNGRNILVTFNCRFMPFMVRIKELLQEGTIGTPLSVHYEWLLDTKHGANYFRRWHSIKANSGGLLVHKSTHHFDLANWFLNDEPEIVNAFGSLRYYGNTRAERGERCLTCGYKRTCEFYTDIEANENHRKFYLECEDVDGYLRDRCVFSDDIDIEDTVSVSVKYKKGAVMSYSLTAHSPYEGLKICINGTNGRIEAEEFDKHSGTEGKKKIRNIRIYNRRKELIQIDTVDAKGEHGGGDARMLEMILRDLPDNALGQKANSRAGAMSIAIGIAANKSMTEQRQIRVDEIIKI